MAEATADRLALRARPPFELRLVLFGHGWVDLAPHRWDAETRTLATAIDLGERAVDVVLQGSGRVLSARVERLASDADRARLRAALRRMLRLDEDFEEFWRLCRADPELAWVARRGAGRLLRAPSVFEDLAKLLLTTNCSWAATRGMVERLTLALGEKTAGGAAAFPSAARCAGASEGFYRRKIRVGYRAKALRGLSEAFASGRLGPSQFEDPALPTEELRRRLLALPGFGPYAAGQALRLLGHYDDLALDAWCRGRLAARRKSGRPPSDRSVEREYARFGRYRGLALWMDLTAHWHGERDEEARRVLRAEP